jgi:micrococcal nuclease
MKYQRTPPHELPPVGCGTIVGTVFVAALLAFTAAYSICAEPTPAVIRGKVTSVTDGDTLTILDRDKAQHKIRLSGIDAPERKQAFGTEAKDLLGTLAFGEHVTAKVEKVDRYGRYVADVILPDKQSASEEMLRAGLAMHYTAFSKSAKLADLEAQARKAKVGLWIDKNPVPPWEYRKRKAKKPAKSVLKATGSRSRVASSGSARRSPVARQQFGWARSTLSSTSAIALACHCWA